MGIFFKERKLRGKKAKRKNTFRKVASYGAGLVVGAPTGNPMVGFGIGAGLNVASKKASDLVSRRKRQIKLSKTRIRKSKLRILGLRKQKARLLRMRR